MSEEELISYLGTIAKSGSSGFIENLKANNANSKNVEDSIIG